MCMLGMDQPDCFTWHQCWSWTSQHTQLIKPAMKTMPGCEIKPVGCVILLNLSWVELNFSTPLQLLVSTSQHPIGHSSTPDNASTYIPTTKLGSVCKISGTQPSRINWIDFPLVLNSPRLGATQNVMATCSPIPTNWNLCSQWWTYCSYIFGTRFMVWYIYTLYSYIHCACIGMFHNAKMLVPQHITWQNYPNHMQSHSIFQGAYKWLPTAMFSLMSSGPFSSGIKSEH